MSEEAKEETLEEFKNSFWYGSRSNTDVKFLKDLTPEQAGEFFSDLLRRLGRAIDDGDVSALAEHWIETQTLEARQKVSQLIPYVEQFYQSWRRNTAS